MENTGQLLFPSETAPRWYLANGTQWQGPFLAQEVYLKVTKGEYPWTGLAWAPGMAAWTPIDQIPTFQAAMPSLPGSTPSKPEVRAAEPRSTETTRTYIQAAAKAPAALPSTPADPKEWFLYYNEAQSGPYHAAEVRRFLEHQTIDRHCYAWKDGMPNWLSISEIPTFEESTRVLTPQAPTPPKSSRSESGTSPSSRTAVTPSERRKSPRQPLLARILLSEGQSLGVAMCRDVSVGGMQVLTDEIPGGVGTELRLNISPPDLLHPDPKRTVEPFVARGQIVRLLEDGRGFSFRFTALGASARQIIEKHVATE